MEGEKNIYNNNTVLRYREVLVVIYLFAVDSS